jgi:acyl-CoA hydrolase
MDLDALSGVIAYRHTGDSVATVTAAVDRITIENPLMEICDLELSGQVTYATGRSSMEVSLQVAKATPEGQKAQPEDVLITCAFTMVSLDPATKTLVRTLRSATASLTCVGRCPLHPLCWRRKTSAVFSDRAKQTLRPRRR